MIENIEKEKGGEIREWKNCYILSRIKIAFSHFQKDKFSYTIKKSFKKPTFLGTFQRNW